MMTLSEFLIPSSEYAARRGPEDVIVLSSHARLARNLCDSSFPSWAKKPERLQILKRISDAVVNLAPMKSCLMESMDNLRNNDKLALM
jgi:protein-arginine kinase